MTKKKILIRIGSLRHGGAEKVLVEFLKNISQDKYEVDLLLNLYSGKYLSDVPSWITIKYLNKGEMITTNRIQDIPVKIYRNIFQKTLKYFPFLLYKYILKGKKYDIEFAAIHGIAKDILKSPNQNSKKIVWIHNDIFSIKGYNEAKVSQFFEFDKILVISNKIKVEFLKRAQTEEHREKIVRIYNPLNTQEIIEKSEEFVQEQFSNSNPVFVSVGTVFPQKGFDRLLKVHKRLLEEGLSHNVLIVGDGYDFENVKKMLLDLQIEETAKMYGYRTNPYPFFKQANFFILSSRYEGFPTVLTEAIVLKKPIIATDVSGVRDLLDDGKYGFIVENSEEGIYKGMKNFLTDTTLVQQYQQQVNQAQLSFELADSIAQIEEIIDLL